MFNEPFQSGFGWSTSIPKLTIHNIAIAYTFDSNWLFFIIIIITIPHVCLIFIQLSAIPTLLCILLQHFDFINRTITNLTCHFHFALFIGIIGNLPINKYMADKLVCSIMHRKNVITGDTHFYLISYRRPNLFVTHFNLAYRNLTVKLWIFQIIYIIT